MGKGDGRKYPVTTQLCVIRIEISILALLKFYIVTVDIKSSHMYKSPGSIPPNRKYYTPPAFIHASIERMEIFQLNGLDTSKIRIWNCIIRQNTEDYGRRVDEGEYNHSNHRYS